MNNTFIPKELNPLPITEVPKADIGGSSRWLRGGAKPHFFGVIDARGYPLTRGSGPLASWVMLNRIGKSIGWVSVPLVAGCAVELADPPEDHMVKNENIWQEEGAKFQKVSLDHAKTGNAGATVQVHHSTGNCSATLIARDLVLTASHCMPNCDPAGNPVIVRAGAHIVDGPYDPVSGNGYLEYTGRGYCSPYAGQENDGFEYEAIAGSNDIALVVLDSDVSPLVSANTVPLFLGDPTQVGLPVFTKTAFNDAPDLTQIAWIVGFGRHSKFDEFDDVNTREGSEVNAYLRRDPCSNLEALCSDSFNWHIPFYQGIGVSYGDSGGPLLDVVDGVERQIGVCSAFFQPPIGETASIYAPLGVTPQAAHWINSFLHANNPGPLLTSVGLFAHNSVKINDRAVASSPDGSSVPVAGSSVEVGSNARVNGSLYGKSVVTIRSGGRVDGSLSSYYRPGMQTPVTTGPWTYGPAYLDTSGLDGVAACLDGIAYAGGESFTVGPAGSGPAPKRTLTPGSYGDVTIRRGAELHLNGSGTFYFDSFDLDSGGKLFLNVTDPTTGFIRIFVKGRLRFQGQQNGNVLASRALLGWTQNTSQPAVSINQSLRMTILAPKGEIVLEPGWLWAGSGFASRIELHQDSRFSYNKYYNAGAMCP